MSLFVRGRGGWSPHGKRRAPNARTIFRKCAPQDCSNRRVAVLDFVDDGGGRERLGNYESEAVQRREPPFFPAGGQGAINLLQSRDHLEAAGIESQTSIGSAFRLPES